MKKFIVERDSKVIVTDYFAIEAETLEEAILKSYDVEPYHTEEFPDDLEPYSYRDSHEAGDKEWEEATS